MSLRISTFGGEPEEIAALAAHGLDDADLLAWDGTELVGLGYRWQTPDGRRRLSFGPTRPDAYAPLAAAVPGECYAVIDAHDEPARENLQGCGFAVSRRENNFEIPVRPVEAPPPPGVEIVPADRVEPAALAALDTALRNQVPGAEGWQQDVESFRRETYESPYYDPLTYQVARAGDHLAGLARVWLGPRPQPRLGLIGVVPAHQRRGVAKALLSAVFTTLAHRGEPLITAEADATNTPSTTLLTTLGARVTGGTLELHRPT